VIDARGTGGITSTGGDTVVVHGTTINGGFTPNGGAGNCDPTGATPIGSHSNIESSNVNGSVSVPPVPGANNGLSSNFFGVGPDPNSVNGNETAAVRRVVS
jgi:hypothetical protein